ncbi:MAG: hypothetical protein CMJ58_02395 [Planctomycetaceae bacterium]|nr:hypothetical protein [Planctomycetaceae bacterium]
MQRNKHPRKNSCNVASSLSGRLTSYSTAAALGAFGVAQQSDAAVVYTDIADVTITQGEGPIYIDLNNDIGVAGQNEFAVAAFANSIRVNPYNLGPQSSEVLTSGSYYVFSFAAGETIGPAAEAAAGGRFAGRVAGAYFYNFVDTGGYVGLKWDFGGDIHYGWARLDVTSANNGTATLFSYAYEDQPDTPIVAGDTGIPEPASLALLAAGGGALALARRRKP